MAFSTFFLNSSPICSADSMPGQSTERGSSITHCIYVLIFRRPFWTVASYLIRRPVWTHFFDDGWFQLSKFRQVSCRNRVRREARVALPPRTSGFSGRVAMGGRVVLAPCRARTSLGEPAGICHSYPHPGEAGPRTASKGLSGAIRPICSPS